MKVILPLLLIQISMFAQKKGDNAVVIPYDVSMNQIKSTLFKAGYSITGTDTLFINTSEKEIPKTTVTIRVMIARIDSLTYMKAQWKTSIVFKLFDVESENNFELAVFRGAKNSLYMQAWGELDRLAKMFSPDVTYIKQ